MTALREAVARAIGATMRLPNHMDRADEVLKAIEAAGFAVVPREAGYAAKMAGVVAMLALVEADNAKCPENTDHQRGMAHGAVMACNSKYITAAYRAMLAAAPPLTEPASGAEERT